MVLRRWSNRRRVLAVVLVLCAFLIPTLALGTNDLGHYANYSGSSVSFNHVNLTTHMHNASSWNEANNLNPTDLVVGHANNADPNFFNGVNVYDDNYGDTTWAGRWYCSYRYSNRCLRGTVQYNLFHITNPNEYLYHRNVACHEEGHAVGLDHTSDSTSCMKSPPSVRTYTTHDKAIINAKY